MVKRPAWQLDHLLAIIADLHGPRLVVKAQQLVGVGDVEVLAHQCHAKGRIEPFDEGCAYFCDAIMVGIAQQGDAVGAGHASAGAFHRLAHHPATDAFAIFRLGWCIGLGHQNVAVGQYIEPARVVELVGEGPDLCACCCLGFAAVRPADGGCDVDGRDQRLVGRGQLRRGATAIHHVKVGGVATARQAGAKRPG
ncbi:hypothetical protein D3C81_1320130 [compost metagenome]